MMLHSWLLEEPSEPRGQGDRGALGPSQPGGQGDRGAREERGFERAKGASVKKLNLLNPFLKKVLNYCFHPS